MGVDSFHVSFNIKRERIDAKGLVPIYTRITIGGQRTFFSSKRKISPNQWDTTKGRAMPLNGNLISLNKYLEIISSTVHNPLPAADGKKHKRKPPATDKN